MKKLTTLILALTSISLFANEGSLELNTEIEDIQPQMSEYLELKLKEDKTYKLIKHRTHGDVYHDGVKQPNKIEHKVTKSELLAAVNHELSYSVDVLFTKCKKTYTNLSTKITCTDYRPRQKEVRAEGQPYEGIVDAIWDISNNIYNAVTPDTREGDKIVITLSKKTGDIKSVKLVF